MIIKNNDSQIGSGKNKTSVIKNCVFCNREHDEILTFEDGRAFVNLDYYLVCSIENFLNPKTRRKILNACKKMSCK